MALDKLSLDDAIDKAVETSAAEIAQAAAATQTPEASTDTVVPTEAEVSDTNADADRSQTVAEASDTDADDDDTDSLSLSAEELAFIKADPKLRKAHKLMNKAFTEKSMALAQDKQLIDALRNSETRAEAAKFIAMAAGLKLAEEAPQQAKTPTQSQVDQMVDEFEQELNTVFDPAITKLIKPMFEKQMARTAKQIMEQEINPLRNATATLTAEAQKAQSEAEVKAFRAAHPGEITPAVEARMYELFQEMPPTKDADPVKYMDRLYAIYKYETGQDNAVKEVTTRMRKAVTSQEPRVSVQPSRVASTTKPTSMDYNKRFDEAWEDAREGR